MSMGYCGCGSENICSWCRQCPDCCFREHERMRTLQEAVGKAIVAITTAPADALSVSEGQGFWLTHESEKALANLVAVWHQLSSEG